MSKVVGDIAIKVGADTTSLVTGMRGAEASLAKFGKIAGGTLAAVGIAMVALTKNSMDNIDVLAKQARSLGLSTQAFQKMSMVAGEAGVEAANLSNMLGKMQRNIDELRQGTVTQTEAFGRLGVSISDLQGLSPDDQFERIARALDAVKDPAEKTALAMEVFGKAGRDAINMLSGYSAAAENAAEFQNRFGIAVSQTASDGIERANDAVGRLGMMMEGLGNAMAGKAAPAIEATANWMLALGGALFGAKTRLEEYFGTLEAAKAALGEDIFNRLMGRPEDVVANGDALAVVANEVQLLGTVAATAAPQFRIFADELESLGEAGAADVMRRIADETERTGEAFADGKITAEEFQTQMAEIIRRAQDITTEFANINGSDFSTAYTNIQGLAQRLWDAAAAAASVRANLPGGSGEMTTGDILTGSGEDLIPRSGLAPTTSVRPMRPGVDSFPESGSGKGGKGGGGGGIKDLFAQRLEAIVEGLKTEKEVIDEWYVASLEALNMANDAQLSAIGGKQEAIERLEREHQERLAGIRAMGNQWGVQAALDGGAEILGAMASTNKKAAKLQGIFAAGSALMSAYQGAAKELEKGTFGFASAAAVIAKGVAFAAAIRSASTSAQSAGGAGSGSSSTSAAPTLSPAQANITYYGTPTQSGMQTITDRLNEEFRQGYRVNWDFQPY